MSDFKALHDKYLPERHGNERQYIESLPISAIAAFPTAAVEVCLLGELVEAVKEEALMRGISVPTPPTQIAKADIPQLTRPRQRFILLARD